MESVRRYTRAAPEVAHGRSGDDCACKICGARVTDGERFVRLKGSDIHEGCVRPEFRFLLGLLGYEAEVKEAKSE